MEACPVTQIPRPLVQHCTPEVFPDPALSLTPEVAHLKSLLPFKCSRESSKMTSDSCEQYKPIKRVQFNAESPRRSLSRGNKPRLELSKLPPRSTSRDDVLNMAGRFDQALGVSRTHNQPSQIYEIPLCIDKTSSRFPPTAPLQRAPILTKNSQTVQAASKCAPKPDSTISTKNGTQLDSSAAPLSQPTLNSTLRLISRMNSGKMAEEGRTCVSESSSPVKQVLEKLEPGTASRIAEESATKGLSLDPDTRLFRELVPVDFPVDELLELARKERLGRSAAARAERARSQSPAEPLPEPSLDEFVREMVTFEVPSLLPSAARGVSAPAPRARADASTRRGTRGRGGRRPSGAGARGALRARASSLSSGERGTPAAAACDAEDGATRARRAPREWDSEWETAPENLYRHCATFVW